METRRKAVLFDGGSARRDTSPACSVVSVELERAAWTAETIRLDTADVSPCRGCFACWVKTPGVCIVDDAGRDLARAFIQSDLAVFVTPVTFGGYSYPLKKAVDRLIPLILPYFRRVDGEVHHVPRYRTYPRLLAIGIGNTGSDEAEVFQALVRRNAINMCSPQTVSCVVVDPNLPDGSDRIAASVREVIGE